MNNLLMRSIRRYRYYGVALLCIVLLVSLTSLRSGAQSYAEQAQSADALVDAVGVATHLRYSDTAYGHFDDIIKPKLIELGVRHIRDGGKDSNLNNKLNNLAASGIKSTLVMDQRDSITPANVVSDVIKPVLASIEAAEGPNEWDTQAQMTVDGESAFPKGVRKYQADLYAAIKADPATSSLPVLMPSLAFPSNSSQLGFLSTLDRGNMHSYAGGNLPSKDLDSKWIPATQIVAGTQKPIIATECGWHNAVSDPNASQSGISEQAAAKYIPRLFLEYFNRGVKRAYVYELINQRQSNAQEDNFGLLRADGSAKPAYTALKNFIQLLKDPGASFQPQTLTYSLSGDLANVHHTLVQKRDGRFYLLLWQEVPSFDTSNKQDLSVASKSITLNINAAMRQATGYYPSTSLSPAWQTVKPTQVQVSVPDHPLVIELVPAT